MQESTTYQAILKEGRHEGRIAGEQQLLIRQGTKRFGNPDDPTLAAIEAIRSIDRLEALGERIVDPEVRDWKSLLSASTRALGSESYQGLIEGRPSRQSEPMQDMRETYTYVTIIRKGVNEGLVTEARRIVYLLGEERFGSPSQTLRERSRGDSRCRAARSPLQTNAGPGSARLERFALPAMTAMRG